ncbi:flavin reductase family protein [Bradyrhizobium zhanjiangense]|uniref:flavin reductase family protein n=1 Tax=Bradyrhizobium zhanjiangense TaxID=1325107 RepID=UPI001FDF0CA3|nr:flavin reductase family protein [Bradyrhizobium zhanjiangense]
MQTISDAKTFWRALGMRAIGAAVVTARGSSGPAGFLALSVTHLTFDPPTMLISIGKTTSALAAVLEAKHFAINYLPVGTEELARNFGGQGPLKGTDRFVPDQWTTLATGAPILKSAVGVLDCELEETIERFETVIAIGRIAAYLQAEKVSPLVTFRGGYL